MARANNRVMYLVPCYSVGFWLFVIGEHSSEATASSRASTVVLPAAPPLRVGLSVPLEKWPQDLQ